MRALSRRRISLFSHGFCLGNVLILLQVVIVSTYLLMWSRTELYIGAYINVHVRDQGGLRSKHVPFCVLKLVL